MKKGKHNQNKNKKQTEREYYNNFNYLDIRKLYIISFTDIIPTSISLQRFIMNST